ncbi:MAG: hypothetical protein A3G74_03600 [Sulfurimonas sp. RIFCSPLOWO2_12_FULL_34_6]|nr:MAG: hypothetical protein A3G74_03600 [Sulfurimonas sp. RIFCSPLOWO2_12_FULL_34_6]
MKKLLIMTLFISTCSINLFASGTDNIFRATLIVDELEYQFNDEKLLTWDTYAYAGYDLNKIYIYSEGEKAKGASFAKSENQLVYSRAISPYWDNQMGVGYDKTQDSHKKWGVIGLQGLAPYFFEIRASLLVAEDGNVGLRAEAEYEALITQKLILTPSMAFAAYTKNDKQMDIGSGFSNLTLGARIRYEFIREFAPYVGVEWNKNFGNTNNIELLDEVYLTLGLRFWF